MRGHNICLNAKIRKIIPKLSLLPLLTRSTTKGTHLHRKGILGSQYMSHLLLLPMFLAGQILSCKSESHLKELVVQGSNRKSRKLYPFEKMTGKYTLWRANLGTRIDRQRVFLLFFISFKYRDRHEITEDCNDFTLATKIF